MFDIIEKFISIDGEGPSSGELAVFIRFCGCNLRCSWCDTKYSWTKDEIKESLTVREVYEYIKNSGITNVTLTGGEPLIQKDIDDLLDVLGRDDKLTIHIETNGAVNIRKFKSAHKYENIKYIVDFKLPSSTMTEKMDLDNLKCVGRNDVYKFVIGSIEDLNKAYEIITKYDLTEKCTVYFSPVLGSIEMSNIVDFMKDKKLNKVRLQVQLHKVIWDVNKRGV